MPPYPTESAYIEPKSGASVSPCLRHRRRERLWLRDEWRRRDARLECTTTVQGLALVHVRAQLEQLQDTFRVKLGYTVDRRAQVELKSERVSAPAARRRAHQPHHHQRDGHQPAGQGLRV